MSCLLLSVWFLCNCFVQIGVMVRVVGGQVGGQTDGHSDGQMDGCVDGWVGGWVDKTDRQLEGWTFIGKIKRYSCSVLNDENV